MNLETFPTSEAAQRMLSYVSNGFYDKSYIAKWLYQVIGLEMDDAHLKFEELLMQVFPETATWGLVYHEQKYGIITNPAKDIEERRYEVIRKRDFRAPMSPARVETIIEGISKTEVKVTENIAPYTFLVEIAADENQTQVNFNMIHRTIKKIKPSHLSFLAIVFFLIELVCSINYKSVLALETEYSVFPRILRNYIDGTIQMNGFYKLDAYKDKKMFELYQSALELKTVIQSNMKLESLCELEDSYQVYSKYFTEIDFETDAHAKTNYQTSIIQESEINDRVKVESKCEFEDNYQVKNKYTERLDIETENCFKTSYATKTELELNVTGQIELEPEIELEDSYFIKNSYDSSLRCNLQIKPNTKYKKHLEIKAEKTIKYKIKQEYDIRTMYINKEKYSSQLDYVIKEIKNKTNYKEEIQAETKEIVNPEYTCELMLEINRSQMNGIRKMNGTRKMKSKVIYYDAI